MANKPKEQADAKATKSRKSKGTLDASTPDIFGDSPQVDMPVDFDNVNPKALHSIIARICRLGGYIGFSAPTGGNAVKLVVSVGGSQGQRWCHDGIELSTHVAHVNNVLAKLEGK